MRTRKLCSSRSILVLACAALASLCFAAQASADDTFTFENHSSWAFDQPKPVRYAPQGRSRKTAVKSIPGETATVALSRTLDHGMRRPIRNLRWHELTAASGRSNPTTRWSVEHRSNASVEGEPANYIEMNVSGLTCVVTNIEEALDRLGGARRDDRMQRSRQWIRPVRVVLPLSRLRQPQGDSRPRQVLQGMAGHRLRRRMHHARSMLLLARRKLDGECGIRAEVPAHGGQIRPRQSHVHAPAGSNAARAAARPNSTAEPLSR